MKISSHYKLARVPTALHKETGGVLQAMAFRRTPVRAPSLLRVGLQGGGITLWDCNMCGQGGEETALEDLQISTPNFLGKGPAPVPR